MNFDITTPKKPKNTVTITAGTVRFGEKAVVMPNAAHIKT
jgi:hypothetical protein